ncbi:hypothetical protein [Streptomyces sp. AS58]|nr:hypothetical protein [Streptomyces sp. AS58]
MEETLLRLEKLLLPSIADVAVLSVDVNNETISIRATEHGGRGSVS